MKHLKKFLEITEYRYIEIVEEEDNLIENIKDLIIEAEDLGYETRIWINEYRTDKDKTEPLSKIEIEFNKEKKVPKEDFNQIIAILKRLNHFLEKTNFKIKKLELYDFSKVTTHTDVFDSLDGEIETNLENVNTYFILIDKKDF